jgi:hypothetical protein
VAAEDGGQTGVRTGVRHPSDPTAVRLIRGTMRIGLQPPRPSRPSASRRRSRSSI